MGHGEMGPWSTRIALHTLSPFRLTFFFKMVFNVTSRVTYPGMGGGVPRGREGERGVGES